MNMDLNDIEIHMLS